MRRAVTLLGLCLVVMTAFPRSADADIWDWLQEFSGPGPFHSGFNQMLDICPIKVPNKNDPAKRDLHWQSTYDAGRRSPCYFMDWRRFLNRDDGKPGIGPNDDNFGAGPIELNMFEFGASMRLHQAFEVGFGAGLMHIEANGRGADKLVLTAPRFVMKPVLIFRSEESWNSGSAWKRKWASVLKYYVRENIISPGVEGKDFGLDPGHPNYDFNVRNDRVLSTGFILDFTEFWR